MSNDCRSYFVMLCCQSVVRETKVTRSAQQEFVFRDTPVSQWSRGSMLKTVETVEFAQVAPTLHLS